MTRGRPRLGDHTSGSPVSLQAPHASVGGQRLLTVNEREGCHQRDQPAGKTDGGEDGWDAPHQSEVDQLPKAGLDAGDERNLRLGLTPRGHSAALTLSGRRSVPPAPFCPPQDNGPASHRPGGDSRWPAVTSLHRRTSHSRRGKLCRGHLRSPFAGCPGASCRSSDLSWPSSLPLPPPLPS